MAEWSKVSAGTHKLADDDEGWTDASDGTLVEIDDAAITTAP